MKVLLEYPPPYDWSAVLGFLSVRAIVRIEVVVDGVYSRSIGLNGVHGTFSIKPAAVDALEVTLDFSSGCRFGVSGFGDVGDAEKPWLNPD